MSTRNNIEGNTGQALTGEPTGIQAMLDSKYMHHQPYVHARNTSQCLHVRNPVQPDQVCRKKRLKALEAGLDCSFQAMTTAYAFYAYWVTADM